MKYINNQTKASFASFYKLLYYLKYFITVEFVRLLINQVVCDIILYNLQQILFFSLLR
jgi:hypothetical protein